MDWLYRLLQMQQPGTAAAPMTADTMPAGLLAPGQGMMAAVPGFDPSDPGAYANRTTGGADMAGYGGSPVLPSQSNATVNSLAMRGGLALMAAGAPQAFKPAPMQAMRPMQPYRPPAPTSLPNLTIRRARGLLSPNTGVLNNG
jgi:hypothetical protein